jgi:hypothetical protein
MQRHGASGGRRRQGDLASSRGAAGPKSNETRPPRPQLDRDPNPYKNTPLYFRYDPLVWIAVKIAIRLFVKCTLFWIAVNNRDPIICRIAPGLGRG